MTIHKEGYSTIVITILALAGLHLLLDEMLLQESWIRISVLILSFVILLLVLQFFRSPKRKITRNAKQIIAPADGKIVVIEQTEENEYFKDKRIQLSIFMSPLNVHVNRYPVSGKIKYYRYHPGLYLVAWHPKSSTENERTTVVIENGSQVPILLRQIAGAVARRIVCYSQEDLVVMQGDEMGFIKFGSRVDLFLPLNSKVTVKLNQKVVGGKTVLAEFS